MKRKGIEIEDKGGGTEDKKSERITETIMKCRKKDTVSLQSSEVDEIHPSILSHID